MFDHSIFNPLSPQGLAISNLFVFILLIAAFIFLVVTGIVTYTAIRYRHKPGQGEPYQEFGRPRLEIVWTVIPLLILVVVFVVTIPAMSASMPGTDPPPKGPADLEVIGHQWWWEIRYPSGVVTANEIHIPVGKRLLVALKSGDVIHALWVPQLNGQMDLTPGQTNTMWLEADKAGVYQGQCGEFCGGPHAWMLIRVIAQPPVQFAAWQRDQLRPATTPAGREAAQGAQLFQQLTCRSCHAIAGTAAQARFAPDLTHFGSRQTLGAGVLTNTPAHLAQWLHDPQTVKPGSHMPNLQLSPSEIKALVAYLESLR